VSEGVAAGPDAPRKSNPFASGQGAARGREVYCADALPWMRDRGPLTNAGAVTSLPDVSEVGLSLSDWKIWFTEAVQLVVRAVPDRSASLFFQTDIKHEGQWIDKGALVMRAAEEVGARVLFHKIVCRHPPGTLTFGRPGYSHFIAVSRAFHCPQVLPFPDVIVDPGRLTWVRAMGIRAAAHAVRFARDQVGATTIFDPFCGVGTVLAVANALGLSAIGVEKSRKRCVQSRLLGVNEAEL